MSTSTHRAAYLLTEHARNFNAVGLPGMVRCYGYDAVEYAVKMGWIEAPDECQFGHLLNMPNFEVTFSGCAMLNRVEQRIAA